MEKDTNRDRMLALYDAAPYPLSLADYAPQGTPLLTDWINAAAPDGQAIHAESNILVAGCGSGAEVFLLAKQYPLAQIVGIDFSERSIAFANAQNQKENLPNIHFEVADITTQEWCKKYPLFDFILCHGVADYVADTTAFLQTMSACLAFKGVLMMTVNSPFHPAKRIKEAFENLGILPESFTDSPEQRTLLQITANLMGESAGIIGIGNAPKTYLEVDIFPPIAHHYSMDKWCELAQEKGLFFGGSLDAPVGLTVLSDPELPLLYNMGKPALSAWTARLRQHAGMQLLFTKKAKKEPQFNDAESILSWKPRLAAGIGALPPLVGEANRPRPLTLRFQGLPDFVIHTTAYDLEVLRRCDGQISIREILENMPVQGEEEHLWACLFRAYHFGVLI